MGFQPVRIVVMREVLNLPDVFQVSVSEHFNATFHAHRLLCVFAPLR